MTLCLKLPDFDCRRKNTVILRTQLSVRVHAVIGLLYYSIFYYWDK